MKFDILKDSTINGLFKILERTEHGLKLVTVDENKFRGVAPEVLQRVARSSLFNMAMLLLVLANAIITATMRHTHKEVVDRRTEKYYYYIEVENQYD